MVKRYMRTPKVDIIRGCFVVDRLTGKSLQMINVIKVAFQCLHLVIVHIEKGGGLDVLVYVLPDSPP